jgi:glycosyltransferase involved in cell wall biosynthesis
VDPGRTNVLHILHSPVFGGPHNSAILMDRWLRERGVVITVLLPTEAQSAADRLRQSGVEVVTMPLHRMRATVNPITHLRWLRAFNREVEDIVGLINEREIAVVVTTSLPNLHGGFAARRAGVSCVWKLVDSFPPAIARILYMPLVRAMADVIMTTGLRIAQQHPGVMAFEDRWVTYYPPVDTASLVARDDTREAVRSELGLDTNDLVIGNVSNINPMKGHRYFIQAAGELLRTYPDAKFVILGQQYEHFTRYADDLWREAASLGITRGLNLHVLDPGSRVGELAQAFDIFWVTSEPRSEGIPTVIGEAKSLGLPVVAADVGSVGEAVTTGVSGVVVAPRAPAQIARATLAILGNPELRSSMAAAARREAEMQFSHERAAAAHLTAYRAAISANKSHNANVNKGT